MLRRLGGVYDNATFHRKLGAASGARDPVSASGEENPDHIRGGTPRYRELPKLHRRQSVWEYSGSSCRPTPASPRMTASGRVRSCCRSQEGSPEPCFCRSPGWPLSAGQRSAFIVMAPPLRLSQSWAVPSSTGSSPLPFFDWPRPSTPPIISRTKVMPSSGSGLCQVDFDNSVSSVTLARTPDPAPSRG